MVPGRDRRVTFLAMTSGEPQRCVRIDARTGAERRRACHPIRRGRGVHTTTCVSGLRSPRAQDGGRLTVVEPFGERPSETRLRRAALRAGAHDARGGGARDHVRADAREGLPVARAGLGQVERRVGSGGSGDGWRKRGWAAELGHAHLQSCGELEAIGDAREPVGAAIRDGPGAGACLGGPVARGRPSGAHGGLDHPPRAACQPVRAIDLVQTEPGPARSRPLLGRSQSPPEAPPLARGEAGEAEENQGRPILGAPAKRTHREIRRGGKDCARLSCR